MADPPRATYRVQLGPDLGFRAAAGIVDHLAALGVSHIYTSPHLQATPGSTHGYDVVDPTRTSAELGGDDAEAELTAALRARGMGRVADVVPNHMGAGAANPWWWDVLLRGRASPWSGHFDIDWDPPEQRLRDTILLPVLGDRYGRELQAGRLRIEVADGAPILRYGDQRFPIAEGTVDPDADLDALNADCDALDAVLSAQHYRLAFWRTGTDDLDYRRFFDIDALVALRIEDERVFEDVHGHVLAQVAEGAIDGLRVDHVDGLRDPAAYLDRLAQRSGGAWTVVEKILEPDEHLRSWRCAGTTGYDFARLAAGVLVDPAAEEPITELYAELTGDDRSWHQVLAEAKREIVAGPLATDVSRVANLLVTVCESDWRYRDLTRSQLRAALAEVTACWSVYRTFVVPSAGVVDSEDERIVRAAVRDARSSHTGLDPDALDFIQDVLLLRVEGPVAWAAVQRFQQLTGPAMAKGVEDTAGYRWSRFIAVNEVGFDPGELAVSAERFHAGNLERQERWPDAMLTTSTHDTKRAEDVRARLLAITDDPTSWAAAAGRWMAGDDAVDPVTRYFMLQTLVGAWPIDVDRACAYAKKATCEAKLHTSWTDPDPAYDHALREWVAGAVESDLVGEAARRLEAPGRRRSLAMTALKLTSPGVPDIYQGTELWDLSLVDPDNRRPVDFDLRRRIVETDDGTACDPESDEVGLSKLRLIRRVLALRERRPDCFGARATYEALEADDDLVAFARSGDVMVVVARREQAAGEVELPRGRWTDVVGGQHHDGGRTKAADLFGPVPVVVLERA